MSKLSRGDILRVLGGAYPNAHVKNQVEHLRGEAPTKLLGRYVAAVVFDLYDEGSSDEANLQRIAQALEFGAATLEGVASGLLNTQSGA